MTYTDKKPTKPGWYWWKNDAHQIKPRIIYVDQDLLTECFSDMWTSVLSRDGQFAGPIPEPVDGVEAWTGGSGGPFTEAVDFVGFEVTHRELSPDGKKITLTVRPKKIPEPDEEDDCEAEAWAEKTRQENEGAE